MITMIVDLRKGHFLFLKEIVFKVKDPFKFVNLQFEYRYKMSNSHCIASSKPELNWQDTLFIKNSFHLLSSPIFLEEPSLSRRILHQWGSMKQVW